MTKVMQKVVLSRSPAETEALGALLVKRVLPPFVAALSGPLGAGKTAFVRGMARALGVERVRSPSFILLNIYRGTHPLYHLDLYRVEDPFELYEVGIADIFHDPEGIVAVEWPERAPELLPPDHLWVQIEILSDHERRFVFTPQGNTDKFSSFLQAQPSSTAGGKNG